MKFYEGLTLETRNCQLDLADNADQGIVFIFACLLYVFLGCYLLILLLLLLYYSLGVVGYSCNSNKTYVAPPTRRSVA